MKGDTTEILVPPCDLWDYFLEHKGELEEEPHIVATSDQVEITLESYQDHPVLTVYDEEGNQYTDETITSRSDCDAIASELYSKYLDMDLSEESYICQDDMISEREDELDDAILALLDMVLEDDSITVLPDSDISLGEICDKLKDHICEYLARDCGFTHIRRPMVLEDENGEDFFTEYPYECMVYDD